MSDRSTRAAPTDEQEPSVDQVRGWIADALTPLPGEVVGMPFLPWLEDEDDA